MCLLLYNRSRASEVPALVSLQSASTQLFSLVHPPECGPPQCAGALKPQQWPRYGPLQRSVGEVPRGLMCALVFPFACTQGPQLWMRLEVGREYGKASNSLYSLCYSMNARDGGAMEVKHVGCVRILALPPRSFVPWGDLLNLVCAWFPICNRCSVHCVIKKYSEC